MTSGSLIQPGVPLIVPSFSSRGFPQERTQLKVVTNDHFRSYAQYFDAFLVSTFDLYFGYVSGADLPSEKTIFVDSGGYESREWDDDSAIYLKHLARSEEPWTVDLMGSVLDQLPDDPRCVFVTYDSEAPLHEQVQQGIAQLKRFKHAKKSFLIKQEPVFHDGKVIVGEVRKLSETLGTFNEGVSSLASFDVIGVTEKSLGSSYYERLLNIRIIRGLLDRAGIDAPIHVFGALDPLAVRIYCVAGADIFDGLTWLRFAYKNEQCVYLNNAILSESEFAEEITSGRDAVYARNYIEMMKLQQSLRDYRESKNIAKLNLEDAVKVKLQKALAEISAAPIYRSVFG